MNRTELFAAQDRAYHEALSFIETAKSERRAATPAETARYNAALDELKRYRDLIAVSPAGIGMSETEKRSYSLVRAADAVQSNDWSKAGLELEASREVEKRCG